MDKAVSKIKKHKKVALVVAGSVIALAILVFFAAKLLTLQASVANYCKVYKDEKARLAALPNGSYPSGVFDKDLSDANEFATSFGRMAAVAPSSIKPDTQSLQSIYATIHNNPADAISASLSGVAPEASVEQWIGTNCK